ncbi:sugar transferase [Candidatus Kaiserbacteria bacterium]|nr:MAG: sugar transferase [Candidatus Kaiserbacteria bacterium]
MKIVPTHPMKRLSDITVSLLLLMLLSPLIILFLVLIFSEHCIRMRPFDPLFYSEERWSGGKLFTLFKFNIFKQEVIDGMRARSEFIYTKTLERDGSLILIGWILKQIYLDELPQLWNVLMGDMSIVGPRPVNVEVHRVLAQNGFCEKDRIRAGMTGHYQATHKLERSGGSQEALDHYYIEFCAHNPWYKVLLFDVQIMLRTLRVLFYARGI